MNFSARRAVLSLLGSTLLLACPLAGAQSISVTYPAAEPLPFPEPHLPDPPATPTPSQTPAMPPTAFPASPQTAAPPGSAPSGAVIGEPRLGRNPGYTRVVFDVPPGTPYRIRSTPQGLQVELDGVSALARASAVQTPELLEWRYEPSPTGVSALLRTPYPLGARSGYRVLVLPPGDGTANQRVVVDLSPAYADLTPLTPEERMLPRFPPGTRVVLDPGHGGTDPGAVGAVTEKEVVLKAALLLRDLLVSAGAEVTLTRSDDRVFSSNKTADLAARARMGSAPHTVFVSIHANALETSAALRGYGIETWWYPNHPASQGLATALQNAMLGTTGAFSRGVRSTNLYVLKNARIPAALVEIGFVSHPVDGDNLKSDIYLQRVVLGIAWGIRNFVQPPG
ncbi:N-acetylmuramoyl-L-alanine amidase [Deinobacterium chartae]|uniref:N-acetylmuramoyl-L-alanine amidase n=1 Tax=Deinobacterium chartae TaxID=521158 RepID=A0A841I318_9DEIO|nr:N-acetylmuramoyl-L-alanine amidase [Deinobacterium chartae]MBB6098748.1 N-acetylmuramoyl-L-alanine amidase [Deinobacterium chartae]